MKLILYSTTKLNVYCYSLVQLWKMYYRISARTQWKLLLNLMFKNTPEFSHFHLHQRFFLLVWVINKQRDRRYIPLALHIFLQQFYRDECARAYLHGKRNSQVSHQFIIGTYDVYTFSCVWVRLMMCGVSASRRHGGGHMLIVLFSHTPRNRILEDYYLSSHQDLLLRYLRVYV